MNWCASPNIITYMTLQAGILEDSEGFKTLRFDITLIRQILVVTEGLFLVTHNSILFYN